MRDCQNAYEIEATLSNTGWLYMSAAWLSARARTSPTYPAVSRAGRLQIKTVQCPLDVDVLGTVVENRIVDI